MAARRHARLLSIACLVVGAFLGMQVLNTTAFVAVGRAAAARPSTARASFSSGKVNLGVEIGSAPASVPKPFTEANEATNMAIMDCIDDGCSVEALMALDSKLASDEKRIQAEVDELKTVQKTAYSEDLAESLAWFDNYLQRTGSLRAQLQALKGNKDTDFVQQLVRAAAVAFGGGRQTDYPKVGVSPYSA